MSRTAILIAAVVLALASAVACGSARRGIPVAGEHQFTDDQVVRGERAYMQYCHQCHPTGETGLAPAINNKPLPRALIRFQVRQGLGAMPAFPERVISDEELEEIIDYLFALRNVGEEPMP